MITMKDIYKGMSYTEAFTQMTHLTAEAMQTLHSITSEATGLVKNGEEDYIKWIFGLAGEVDRMKQDYINLCKVRNTRLAVFDKQIGIELRERAVSNARAAEERAIKNAVKAKLERVNALMEDGKPEEAKKALKAAIGDLAY